MIFMKSLALFFRNCHTQRLKQIFAEVLVNMLTPLSKLVTAEVNIPEWIEFVDILLKKVEKMSLKLKHAHFALPLNTIVLSIVTRDTFMQKFPQFLDSIVQKLRDKALRQISLKCMSTLLWIYLFRYPDSMSSIAQKLAIMNKMLFPFNRKNLFPPDCSLNTFVEIIVTTAGKLPDYAFQNQVFNLLHVENVHQNLESMPCDRYIVGLRSFMSITDAIEGRKHLPEFPSVNSDQITSNCMNQAVLSSERKILFKLDSHFEKVESICAKLLTSLVALLDDGRIDMKYNMDRSKEISSHTLASLIFDCIPKIFPKFSIEGEQLLYIIANFTVYKDVVVARSALGALERVIEQMPAMRNSVITSLHKVVASIPENSSSQLQKGLSILTEISKSLILMDSSVNLSLVFESLFLSGLLCLTHSNVMVRKEAREMLRCAKVYAESGKITGSADWNPSFMFKDDFLLVLKTFEILNEPLQVSLEIDEMYSNLQKMFIYLCENCPYISQLLIKVQIPKFLSLSEQCSTGNVSRNTIHQWEILSKSLLATQTRLEFRKIITPQSDSWSAEMMIERVFGLFKSTNEDLVYASIRVLGAMNFNFFPVLFTMLRNDLNMSIDQMRNRKSRKGMFFKNWLSQVYLLVETISFVQSVLKSSNASQILAKYIKELFDFLVSIRNQSNWEIIKLKNAFCCLVSRFVSSVTDKHLDIIFPVRQRVLFFITFENWSGHGGSQIAFKSIEATTMSQTLEQVKDIKDRSILLSKMDAEKRKIELSALRALEVLLNHLPDSYEVSHLLNFNDDSIFQWAEKIFASANQELKAIATRGLVNRGISDLSRSFLVSMVMFCHSSRVKSDIKFEYLNVLLLCLEKKINVLPLSTVLLLAQVRLLLGSKEEQKIAVSIYSVVKQCYPEISKSRCIGVHERQDFSVLLNADRLWNRFVINMPELAEEIFFEICDQLEIMDIQTIEVSLELLVPWMSNIYLGSNSQGLMDISSFYILNNLVYISERYKSIKSISSIWQKCLTFPQNVTVVSFFLFNLVLGNCSLQLVDLAKRTFLFCCNARISSVVGCLVHYLSPVFVKVHGTNIVFPKSDNSKIPFYNLRKVFHVYETLNLSAHELSLIIWSDISASHVSVLETYTPIIIHSVMLNIDAKNDIVSQSCERLLKNLTGCELNKGYRWPSTDLRLIDFEYKDCENVAVSVSEILESVRSKSLEIDWFRIAFQWAVLSDKVHFVCRSFQFLPPLLRNLDAEVVPMLLKKFLWLVNEIDRNESQLVGIFLILSHITNRFSANDPVVLRTLFWFSYALLHSAHEGIFIQSCILFGAVLEILLGKGDFSLIGSPPSSLKSSLDFQMVIMKGLKRNETEKTAIRLLEKVLPVSLPNNLTKEDALLRYILAFLPRLLQSDVDRSGVLDQLSRLALELNFDELSKVLDSLARNKFRVIEEFIQKISQAIIRHWYPLNAKMICLYFCSLLENSPEFYKVAAMQLLRWLLTPDCVTELCSCPEFESEVVDILLTQLDQTNTQQVLQNFAQNQGNTMPANPKLDIDPIAAVYQLYKEYQEPFIKWIIRPNKRFSVYAMDALLFHHHFLSPQELLDNLNLEENDPMLVRIFGLKNIKICLYFIKQENNNCTEFGKAIEEYFGVKCEVSISGDHLCCLMMVDNAASEWQRISKLRKSWDLNVLSDWIVVERGCVMVADKDGILIPTI